MSYKKGDRVWCRIYNNVRREEGLLYVGPVTIYRPSKSLDGAYFVSAPVDVVVQDTGYTWEAGYSDFMVMEDTIDYLL